MNNIPNIDQHHMRLEDAQRINPNMSDTDIGHWYYLDDRPVLIHPNDAILPGDEVAGVGPTCGRRCYLTGPSVIDMRSAVVELDDGSRRTVDKTDLTIAKTKHPPLKISRRLKGWLDENGLCAVAMDMDQEWWGYLSRPAQSGDGYAGEDCRRIGHDAALDWAKGRHWTECCFDVDELEVCE